MVVVLTKERTIIMSYTLNASRNARKLDVDANQRDRSSPPAGARYHALLSTLAVSLIHIFPGIVAACGQSLSNSTIELPAFLT